ncbi:acyl-CoA transferase [Celeribacter halophilus]|uniref:Acyl-CoA transferase n=1 Tax=Celeribacter halophilus TaxID=576117 RepID=A0A1I3WYF4_9RHOB|nr:acyl-CoA transferase [Celeribacter halophilus]PZX04485.1 hypothetical protein LX82_03676 [Celeribacter halophilus]SFK12420.1 hypothetical protein SAMN04488138_1348 [Celeribacter halophilus]
MADSYSEQVLKALYAKIQAAAPSGALVARNAAYPESIPRDGAIILRDGNPGDPEFLFSPPCYVYEHYAEVDLLVEATRDDDRDAKFDVLKQAIGVAVSDDRTLGGLCDYVLGQAPAPVDLTDLGAIGLKAATVGVILTYGTPDPLG